MADFSHLEKLAVTKDRHVEYTLFQIEGTPTLIIAPATDANKKFHSAALKRSTKAMRRLRGANITPEMLEDDRDDDRRLYPKHVIVGWRDMMDASGKPVKFTVPACQDFVNALPNWVFDDLRAFAANPANFLTDDDADDPGDLAKN